MVTPAASWRGSSSHNLSIRDLSLLTVPCPSDAPTNIVTEEEIVVGSGLSYSGNGVWHFNWKSPKTASECRDFNLRLSGTTDPYVVKLKLR